MYLNHLSSIFPTLLKCKHNHTRSSDKMTVCSLTILKILWGLDRLKMTYSMILSLQQRGSDAGMGDDKVIETSKIHQ